MKHTSRLRSVLPVLLLAVALSGAGIAYTHWTETLEAHVDVDTGEVAGGWLGAGCFEFFDWPWPAEGFGEVEGKDVASTTVTIPDPGTLEIAVENAYPSYAVDCEIEWINTGTIPVIIRGWRFVEDPVVPSNLENCNLTVTGGGDNLMYECDELTVVLIDGTGVQVDPGEIAASSLRFHVEQDNGLESPEGGNQSTTLRFWLEVCVSNWNEPHTGDACFAVDDLIDG